MTHYLSTTAVNLSFTGMLNQGGPSPDSQHPGPLIHILDDYSLLYIFSLSRPSILDENEVDHDQVLEGGEWTRELWWYRLVQVCRRWRGIVFESASHLRLSLVCARGTPVVDMLAHSPPLPLIIDHLDLNYDITTEEEEGILLALQCRDRVRRIRLRKSVPILQKLVNALDGEFPILEYLYAMPQQYQRPLLDQNMSLNLPETFRAPHLRHLLLMRFAIPIGSPLLTTMGNLVTLSHNLIPHSAYFHPYALLQRLSLMPQLETLGIFFNSHFPSRDIERQLLRTRITTSVTLPNLQWLGFQGASAYLEALLSQVTIPLLETLQVYFFNQLTYSIPHLQQFISTAGNLRLEIATLSFLEDYVKMKAYPDKEAKMFALCVHLGGRHLDWQVASAARVFHTLGTIFSAVDHLTLESDRHVMSSEWNNEADRTQWRELLGSFVNVNTLSVGGELVGQLSHALQPGEGESPTELLPELHELHEPDRPEPPDEPGELSDSAMGAPSDVFSSFIDARQKAGHPVSLIHP
ncbi:hypothetical protein DFH94DRAFT_856853 [Russula ochroleuca]|uniref:Uncharacterized protein n=1 Tax=Russula ochroleuca TaxID=152965 RepID=A0A9P5JY69_9AGAM|nr:hypothetical protein DFH94DRAFT_856853 [Russula ochroleuca]